MSPPERTGAWCAGSRPGATNGPGTSSTPRMARCSSASRGRVLTASFDGTARVWDARTGDPLGPALKHTGEVWSARFSRDGEKIVTASLDGTAGLWEATNGRALTPPLAHEAQVHQAEFSPDDRWVVTASNDTTVRLWDAETGQASGRPLAHERGVRWVQFSRDGRRLLTVTEGDSAWIWDVATRRRLASPLRHRSTIRTATFSPDGGTVVTGADDGTLRWWDAETGQALSEPIRHRAPIVTARFAGDGQALAVGMAGAEGQVYELPAFATPAPAWLPQLARQLAGATADTPLPRGPEPLHALARESAAWRSAVALDRWRQWFFADRTERPLSLSVHRGYELAERLKVLRFRRDPASLREWVQRRPADSEGWCWILATPQREGLSPYPFWQAAAEQQLERLARENPDDRVALWATLERWPAGSPQEAGIRWVDHLVCRWPASINAWCAQGILLQRAGRSADAREAFARALRLAESDPRDAARRREAMLLNRATLLKRLGRLEEARLDYRSDANIPPRDPGLGAEVIDLSPYYNATLDEAWYDARASGNRSLLPFQVGYHRVHETGFDARGLVQLAGPTTAAAAAPFPGRVEGIPIQAPCRRLHFLVGTHGAEAEGASLGSFLVHFRDGATETVPLGYGRELRDWHFGPDSGPAFDGVEARNEPNPAGELVRLFHLCWENPRPDVPVARLDFASVGARSAPFVVGITLE